MCRRTVINDEINGKSREMMHEPVDQKLAYRLRELRAHCNISLAELARAVGVTKGTAWKYVHGKSHVPAERLETLARVMHCEESDLHTPPGSPLPRLRFRPARGPGGQSSRYKIVFNPPHYVPVSADEFA
jgi:transcriptional regulator with XRE-family HTH domain